MTKLSQLPNWFADRDDAIEIISALAFRGTNPEPEIVKAIKGDFVVCIIGQDDSQIRIVGEEDKSKFVGFTNQADVEKALTDLFSQGHFQTAEIRFIYQQSANRYREWKIAVILI